MALAAGVIQAAFIWIKYKKLQTMQWVNYKLFGSTGLLIAFVLVQTAYLSRFIPKEPN